MVDLSRNARLADFGLASALNQATTADTNLTGGGGKGTLRWLAPELLDTAKPRTDMSDVYALAMTIWEARNRENLHKALCSHYVVFQVFTAEVPFSQIEHDVIVLSKVLNGARPPKPVDSESVGFSDELWNVMQRGWAVEPDSRAPLASFIEVLHDC
jgi:serine/threonine protein kinase